MSKGIVMLEDLQIEPVILYYPGGLTCKIEEKYNISINYVLHLNQVLTIVNYIQDNLASTGCRFISFVGFYTEQKMQGNQPLLMSKTK